jgi:RNA polymerase sigma-70 factor (ECF subfamily)
VADAHVSEIAQPNDSEAEWVDFETFVAEHYGRLVGLAGLIAGDAVGAEDVVQTALERAWRARHSFRADAQIRPWLDKIVVREAARDRRLRLRWLARLLGPPRVTMIDGPSREILDRDASGFPERSALRMALAGLSAPQRAAVVLHLDAGYSVDETAKLLGVPRETVRSRLRVAREHLRSALREGH